MTSSLAWSVLLILLNACHTMQSPARMPRDSSPTSLQSSTIPTPNQSQPTTTTTLSELVKSRPPPKKTEERHAFRLLFAKHPKVKALDRHHEPLDVKALKEGWATIRREEKGQYNSKKMENAINDHLREVKKVSEEVVQAVRFRWQKEIYTSKDKRHRDRLNQGATPQLAAKRKDNVLKNRMYRKQVKARDRAGKRPWPFEDYMTVYGIEKGLPAKELEFKSRVFRHEYSRNTAAATLALKDYLEAQKYDPLDIDLALGARSDDFRRALKLRDAAERKTGQKGKVKQQRNNNQEQHTGSASQDEEIVIEPTGTSQASLSRKRKIQNWLDSNKKWHSTSNL